MGSTWSLLLLLILLAQFPIRFTASVSDIPLEFSFAEQCRASQLAEETCLEKATATSSLEAAAVEEILYTSPLPSYSQGPSVSDPWLFITMCLLGMVSIGSVSVVGIVALFFGSDISLSTLLKPLGFLKFKAKNRNRAKAKAKDAKDKETKDKETKDKDAKDKDTKDE